MISRLSSAPPLPVAPGRRRPAHRRLTVEVLHIGDPQRADPGAYVLDAQAGQSAFGVYDERGDTRSDTVVAGYPKLGTVSDLVAYARTTRLDLIIFTTTLFPNCL